MLLPKGDARNNEGWDGLLPKGDGKDFLKEVIY